jgi:hypothetical protein
MLFIEDELQGRLMDNILISIQKQRVQPPPLAHCRYKKHPYVIAFLMHTCPHNTAVIFTALAGCKRLKISSGRIGKCYSTAARYCSCASLAMA